MKSMLKRDIKCFVMAKDVKKRIEQLRHEIRRHDYLYYVRAKIMRCGGLQSAFILHHAFDGCGDLRSSKPFAFTLGSLEHWERCFIDREIVIDIEDAIHLFLCFLCIGMGGVTFLPIELSGAQEEFRAQFPAEY